MDEMQDLRDRVAAYQDGPPPEGRQSAARLEYLDLQPPLRWTPEWVVLRMEFAFKVLLFTSGRVGPTGFKASSLYREYIPELALVEKEAHEEHAKERADDALNTLPTVTPDHIAYCDEALSWPSRHLADDQMMRDAIMLYCMCLATGRHAAPILRARKARAAALAKKLEAHENARQARARGHLAQAVALWANDRIAKASDKKQVAAIKANAMIRMEREVRKAGLTGASVRPHEAMPGVILAPSTLDKYRKLAAAALCQRLQAAGVPVR